MQTGGRVGRVFLRTHNLGVQLGVKLPTGKDSGQNVLTGAAVGRSPAFRSSGPNGAGGQALDTSLQPGTGSTDVIVGAYYYQPVSQNFDAFVNGQFQSAVIEDLHGLGQDYRPGNLATVSVGLRYEKNSRIVPQLQINVTCKSANQGALADTANTAGTAVYLSPGVTVNVMKNLHVYAFVQKALYSRLSGYQLFPRWSGTLGRAMRSDKDGSPRTGRGATGCARPQAWRWAPASAAGRRPPSARTGSAHARRTQHCDRRSARKRRHPDLLGDLVRALPNRTAAVVRVCRASCGARLTRARFQPGRAGESRGRPPSGGWFELSGRPAGQCLRRCVWPRLAHSGELHDRPERTPRRQWLG